MRILLPHRSVIWSLVVGLWFAIVSAGFFAFQQYENTAAAEGAVAEHWPAGTTIPRDPQRPTLICILHPRCPCSRVSIDELAQVLAKCDGRVAAQVLLWTPADADASWAHSDLWDAAARIPGVAVQADPGGVEAQRLGATASTHSFLYAPDGRLLFHGGMTGTRGMGGPNLTRRAMLEWVLTGQSTIRATPVFGCSLQD